MKKQIVRTVVSKQTNLSAPLHSLDWRNRSMAESNVRKAFRHAQRQEENFERVFGKISKLVDEHKLPLTRSKLKELWVTELTNHSSVHSVNVPPPVVPKPSVIAKPKPFNPGAPSAHRPSGSVVVDGTNVLYGSPSNPAPSLCNVLGLVTALKVIGREVKCFFDANTAQTLESAKAASQAQIYRQLSEAFPNTFISVPAGSPADDFLIDYADGAKAVVISNDLFREYQGSYPWLNAMGRRASFLVYNGMIHVAQLRIRAAIPQSAREAVESLWKQPHGYSPAIIHQNQPAMAE